MPGTATAYFTPDHLRARRCRHPSVAADIEKAQERIHRADHLLIVFPLWKGTMPALLKGFLEQALRRLRDQGCQPGDEVQRLEVVDACERRSIRRVNRL